MNRLSLERRATILGMLTEGNSLRATTRMAGVSINTVSKLLVDVGAACSHYHDATVRGLKSERVQCDEIWSFCHSKQKNVRPENEGKFGYGDVWTWTAIDADSKLIVSYWVGRREIEDARAFIGDLAKRLSERVQLTTDGHGQYVPAIKERFGLDVDFAQLIKKYGKDYEDDSRRYSPAVCTGIDVRVRSGNPDAEAISTSYVERSNLTVRMGMRRFTRLTNAHSKKIDNHAAAVALHFMHYNFARPHSALKNPYPRTPAIAAGIADHVWTLADIARLAD